MQHRSSGLLISDAIDGLLLAKLAEGRSPRTITGYRHDLRVWLDHTGDKDVAHITSQEIQAFLLYLRTDYRPRRLSGDGSVLAAKTIRNFWVSLSALFSWLRDAFELPSPMAKVPAPTFSRTEIEPFGQADVEALLKACDYKREAQTHRRRPYTMRRPTALRDRAIILTLLDTGLRSSELCALTVDDADLKTGKVTIRGGAAGGAKGGKGRTVYLGAAVRRAVWRYLVTRDDKTDERAPLFSTGRRRLTRDAVRHMVVRLGDAAHIKNAHPHRFRHYLCHHLLTVRRRRFHTPAPAGSRLAGHGAVLCAAGPGRSGASPSTGEPGRQLAAMTANPTTPGWPAPSRPGPT